MSTHAATARRSRRFDRGEIRRLAVDLNTIGIVIVVTFLLTWIGAVALWKLRRFDQRHPARTEPEADQAAA